MYHLTINGRLSWLKLPLTSRYSKLQSVLFANYGQNRRVDLVPLFAWLQYSCVNLKLLEIKDDWFLSPVMTVADMTTILQTFPFLTKLTINSFINGNPEIQLIESSSSILSRQVPFFGRAMSISQR